MNDWMVGMVVFFFLLCFAASLLGIKRGIDKAINNNEDEEEFEGKKVRR
jgi:hypothetical protein